MILEALIDILKHFNDPNSAATDEKTLVMKLKSLVDKSNPGQLVKIKKDVLESRSPVRQLTLSQKLKQDGVSLDKKIGSQPLTWLMLKEFYGITDLNREEEIYIDFFINSILDQ